MNFLNLKAFIPILIIFNVNMFRHPVLASEVKDLTKKVVQLKGLEPALLKQCESRRTYFDHFMISFDCSKTIRLFLHEIDFKLDYKNGNGLTYFSSRWETLSQSQEELDFIRRVKREIEISLFSQAERPIDLWNIILTNSPDFDSAVERAAIYFQMTVPWLNFLRPEKGEAAQTSIRFQIQQTISTILSLISQFANRFMITIDSEEVPVKQMYHFFSAAYLTSLMNKKGIAPEVSGFLPFEMNWIYEIITDRGSYLDRFIDLSVRHRPFVDESIRDILLGYRGVLFGLTQKSVGRLELRSGVEQMKVDPSVAYHEMLMEILSTKVLVQGNH